MEMHVQQARKWTVKNAFNVQQEHKQQQEMHHVLSVMQGLKLTQQERQSKKLVLIKSVQQDNILQQPRVPVHMIPGVQLVQKENNQPEGK